MVAALVDYPRESRLSVVARTGATRPRASGARPATPAFDRREAGRGRASDSRGATAEIYRRRRLGALAVVLIALALLITVMTLAVQAALGRTGGGLLTATGALPGGQLAGSQVYVVQPGDTVWSIARSIDPKGDVRPLVDRITSQLGGTGLFPGERVTISLSR